MTDNVHVNLYGRVFIEGNLQAVTGLHIGGAAGALEIGGVDSPIIRDPLTNRPYIPGSSLRGKMRSLTEKVAGAELNFFISRVKGKEVRIHVCNDATAYQKCAVCPIFGVTGDSPASAPTRLIVRDVFLGDASAKALEQAQTDLPFSEVKWEATIDRVTSAAVPRQIERVPAGAVFQGFEMVYSVYDPADLNRLVTVIEAMQLLEDDYLGGLGSRGGGKIAFQGLRIYARNRLDYGKKQNWGGDAGSVARVLEQKDELITWARATIPTA